jgi:hypothetical protein
MRWDFLCLISELGLFFPDFDVFQNAPVGRFVDNRTDHNTWFRRIADSQTGCGRNQTFHHAIIIFLEQNQTRERGALLSLKTECRIN